MPALLNIAANVIFGGVLALVARHSPGQRNSVLAWPLLFLLAFEAVLFTPVATYLFRFYPQWSMLYWFDPQLVPNLENWVGSLSALAICMNFGGALGGYLLTRAAVVRGRLWVGAIPVVVGALAFLYLLVIFGDRIAFIGDYDAFWTGDASLIFKRFPGWLGLLSYLSAFLFLLWVHTRFADHDPTIL